MRIFFIYIDPGSGSYLVQMLIAGVLAGVFYFKNMWLRVKSFFSKSKKEGPLDND